jgi:hypothetical protein
MLVLKLLLEQVSLLLPLRHLLMRVRVPSGDSWPNGDQLVRFERMERLEQSLGCQLLQKRRQRQRRQGCWGRQRQRRQR